MHINDLTIQANIDAYTPSHISNADSFIYIYK